MGMIINIDEALKLRTDYNILREPLNDMMKKQQEAWERENPIDLLFNRGSISQFQETYTSSIGFDKAFAETSDYNVGPIFNTAEGFAATYRTRTFQGGFIITQQTLEDRQIGRAKDDASAFVRRWHGDIVEYAMTAIDAGFGVVREFGSGDGKSKLKLYSADTTDGAIDTATKNPLFCKTHKTVKRDDKSTPISQSNMFYANIDLMGNDAGKIAKLADAINQVITKMENYKDDNGKFAGVLGEKTIVAANDPHLKAAIETALSMDMFKQGESMAVNPAYKRATLKTTPYLGDTNCCGLDAKGFSKGFFIVDKSYNAQNHGLELTERIPFTLDAFERKEAPKGIKYEGRQRFDINVATWRGIAYVYIGTPSQTATDWNYFKSASEGKFEELALSATIVTPFKNVEG
jgi:hypothetical protein